MKNKPGIRIVKNGPYLVTGSVPLKRTAIVPKGRGYEYRVLREYPLQAEYSLCRCGHSRNAPYCDGSHTREGFDGAETASRLPYRERAYRYEGPTMDLLDDDRCAYARFCHRNLGDVWELTEASDDREARDQAVIAAGDCPSGRFLALDKEGHSLEPVFSPAIEVLEDTEEGVSGPLFVKGGIPLEAADGTCYEVRNRIALCRCGQAENKPFCDATHAAIGFLDGDDSPLT